MDTNFQTSTLFLTLPISCQICLGKVRRPVICTNHHVFCATCMEMWVKNSSQCPTCRVPITSENPYKEIIGGSNESDHSDSPSTRKRLRKTRGELLFQEYEVEIESLMKENEELKTKQQHLELQLKTALDPASSLKAAQSDDKKVDPYILEELANKLRAATDACDEVKHDMDRLKEANKVLRSQNLDLVRENMRLKSEVASRSPQKFGRYTVAALEAKIQQYERDVEHLKKALERSDQYIDDLENQLRKSEQRPVDMQPSCIPGKAQSEPLTQQIKIDMMRRSTSDDERASICSNPLAESGSFPSYQSLMFMPSVDQGESNKTGGVNQSSAVVDSTTSDLLPSTPSTAFRSLTVRSPTFREKRVSAKSRSYLRKLDFDGIPSPRKSNDISENPFGSFDKFSKSLSSNTEAHSLKSVFWGAWHKSKSSEQPFSGQSKAATSNAADEPDTFQKYSEASMDAAFLDKISELDSMMLEGESSSSRGSQLSLAPSSPAKLDATLVPEPAIDDEKVSEGEIEQNQLSSGTLTTEGSNRVLKGGTERGFSPLRSDEVSNVPACAGHRVVSQSGDMPIDLLFDPMEASKAGPSETRMEQLPDSESSFSCLPGESVNTPRERLMFGHGAKRRSYSPFNTSSPTKLSKLI
ncbi:ORC ubiquitin ligase 1 [Neosynchiropus ocellatus]